MGIKKLPENSLCQELRAKDPGVIGKQRSCAVLDYTKILALVHELKQVGVHKGFSMFQSLQVAGVLSEFSLRYRSTGNFFIFSFKLFKMCLSCEIKENENVKSPT